MRLCIGRSALEDKQCNQWDGAVENVKLWARALDEVGSFPHTTYSALAYHINPSRMSSRARQVDPTHQGLLVGAVQDTHSTDTETYATRVSIVYAVRTIKLLLNDTHVKSISARPVTRNPFVLNHVDYIWITYSPSDHRVSLMNGIRFARGDDDEHIIASPEKELSSIANRDASDDQSISSASTLSITDHDVVSDGGLLAVCGSRGSNDLVS
jgi:hypothetical protein